MKKWMLGIVIASAAVALYWTLGRQATETYSSKTLRPTASFQYPKNWTLKADHGRIEDYSQLLISGPRNPAGTYDAMLIVRQSPIGARYKTVDERLDRITAHTFIKSGSLRKGSVMLDGRPAKTAAYVQAIPPSRFEGLKPLPINARFNAVIAEQDGKLYEILYTADEMEYPKYLKNFEKLLKTFRFQ